MNSTILNLIFVFTFQAHSVEGGGFIYEVNLKYNDLSFIHFSSSTNGNGGINSFYLYFFDENCSLTLLNMRRNDEIFKKDIIMIIKLFRSGKTWTFNEDWQISSNITQKLIEGKWERVGQITYFSKTFYMEQNFDNKGQLEGLSYIRSQDKKNEIAICMYKNGKLQPEFSKGQIEFCWGGDP